MDKLALLQARSQLHMAAAPVMLEEPLPVYLPPSPIGKVELRQSIGGEINDAFEYAEMKRICSMPLTFPMTAEELEAYNRDNVQVNEYMAGFRLFREQAEAVMAYELAQGVFAPIGVGFGKTLATLMIASKAFQKGIKQIVLLVPPQVLHQLVNVDLRWARTKVYLSYPINVLGGQPSSQRKAISMSGKKGLYIIPYSMLSTKDADENLTSIQPGLIIADEAHNLNNRSAARTKRVMRYISGHPGTELVVLSGTITSKSINDYWHLIKNSLNEHNPLPNSAHLASDWASILDAEASRDGNYASSSGASGSLLPLIEWAKRHFPTEIFNDDVSGFRKAYRFRLNHSLGVVSSGENSIGTSLVLVNRPVPNHEATPGWPQLMELCRTVTDAWLTPNGDIIEHAIHMWKWLNELTAGFYNQLVWPTPTRLAEKRTISEAEAGDLLGRALEHHAAGQAYAKILRKWLQDESKPGLDTPFLVGSSMSQHGADHVSGELHDAWRYMKALDFEHRPEREPSAVRVCGYKVIAATEWAKEVALRGEGGLIWAYHQETVLWLYETLVQAGLPAIYCPAGAQYNVLVGDTMNANKIVVASIAAHGTGKNLQHFHNQFFFQWPRPAKDAEQVIGRTHRSGQKADSLDVLTCHTTEFDEANFAACLNDALYIQQTTGVRQKIIYATYDPLPKIFPSAVLIERGLLAKRLSAEQQQILNERFIAAAA